RHPRKHSCTEFITNLKTMRWTVEALAFTVKDIGPAVDARPARGEIHVRNRLVHERHRRRSGCSGSGDPKTHSHRLLASHLPRLSEALRPHLSRRRSGSARTALHLDQVQHHHTRFLVQAPEREVRALLASRSARPRPSPDRATPRDRL